MCIVLPSLEMFQLLQKHVKHKAHCKQSLNLKKMLRSQSEHSEVNGLKKYQKRFQRALGTYDSNRQHVCTAALFQGLPLE